MIARSWASRVAKGPICRARGHATVTLAALMAEGDAQEGGPRPMLWAGSPIRGMAAVAALRSVGVSPISQPYAKIQKSRLTQFMPLVRMPRRDLEAAGLD